MEQYTIGKALVCYESYKYLHHPELKNYLKSQEFQAFALSFEQAVILVLGGDGAMLHAIAEFQHLGIPFLGINFGNKGFLLHPREHLGTYGFEPKYYPVLRAKGVFGDHEIEILAFNEIDLRARDGRVMTLNVEGICPKKSIEFSGDGLIISTSVGSSGYNLSLGGPLVSHALEVMILTPKAVLEPRGMTSYVIPLTQRLSISNTGRKNGGSVYADSQLVYAGDALDLHIQFQKPTYVQLMIPAFGGSDWQYKFFSLNS